MTPPSSPATATAQNPYSTRPALVFVHGICHGAWCWEDHFIDYFSARGWDCLAVTLRGHDSADPSPRALRHRIADYVADVRAVTTVLPSSPVLIGHSMGGYIVQKYLQSAPAAAAVLLAAMPPRAGLLSPLLWRHPLRLAASMARGNMLRAFNTPARCREVFFSKHTPGHTVENALRRLTPESSRAGMDMLGGDRVRLPLADDVPVLVMGAAEDRIFHVSQINRTAQRYGTTAVIVAQTGHDMMLEPTWNITAGHIDSWLSQRFGLTTESPSARTPYLGAP